MLSLQSILTSFFLMAALVVTSAGIISLVRYQTPVTRWGGMLMLAIGLDMLSYFLMLVLSTPKTAQVSFLFLVITYLFLVVIWLFFILSFCRLTRWINGYTTVLIGIIPMIMGVLVCTHPGIEPVWINHGRESMGSLMVLTREFGWFGDLFIAYTFGVGLLSTVLLFQILPNTNSYFRELTIFLLTGSLGIIILGWLEASGKNPFVPISSLQIGYVFASILAFLFVVRIRAGGSAPIIRGSILEYLQDGILVLDSYDNVIDINQSAEQILGRSDKTVIGMPICRAWPAGENLLRNQAGAEIFSGEFQLSVNGAEFPFDIKISPVLDVNQTRIGRTVVLRNMTGRERMEKTLHERTIELARTNKLITSLSSVGTRLGSAQGAELGFEILGAELRKLGLDCVIVTIDPAGEAATIKYLSFNPALIRQVEKTTGISGKDYVIPKQYWPGDRILKERQPIWYPNPHAYIRKMFPQIPDKLANWALQLLGIRPASQICILPLLVEERLIGAMPIWGADLHPADNPVLALFASQVAAVLQNAVIRENETIRANALARSHAMVLSLSKVATMLGQSSNTEIVLDTLGSEIHSLGLDCGIVTLDQAGETATIKYLSFAQAVIQRVEKMAGVSIQNYSIPKRYWPDDRVMREKIPVWYSDPSDILRGMFPKIPDKIAKQALQIFGFQSKTQLCMLPLISNEQMLGVILIWGVELRTSDNPVLAVFASQVAGILQKIGEYEAEVERTNELTRSNAMILALSKVAAQLESSAHSMEIFNTVGKELKILGFNSIVGTLDDSKKNLHIKYLSVQQEVIHWAEKVTEHSLDELSIPRHLWPTEKVVTEKVPYWDPNRMRGTLNMFPILPESLHKVAIKMAGINMEDPVCYLPLANKHDVIGVLAVWGAGLKQTDVAALSVLANQIATAIGNSELFEKETRRAMELDVLLKASDSAMSSTQLNKVLPALASTLLRLSGFESCYISEWNKETNVLAGLIDHSRVYWLREKRDSYSLRDYSRTRDVLLTGSPVLLQGEFDAEEKRWMTELGRTALIILALKAGDRIMGLIEIASTREKHSFDPQVLQDCQTILEDAAHALQEPLSDVEPQTLFTLEEALLKASGGEICSVSEWDQAHDCILTLAVSADVIWTDPGSHPPQDDPAGKMALDEGEARFWMQTEETQTIGTRKNSSVELNVETTIVLPLQYGNEKIGLIELYDFNHKRNVTPAQLTLLRTVADKASYSIQNARLLQQAQQQLREKTLLLDEKEVLIKEVHHRVKNNLQVISSLLNLQATKISDIGTKDVLRESQNRVRTMALIHEKLYQSSDLAQVDFASYLRGLASFLLQSYRGRSENVSIQVDAENIMLDIDTAIPCGLIANELVSNCLKYAFPESRRGCVRLTCRHINDDDFVLTVSDDGVGLPEGFEISKTQSLGYKLVESLTNQLDGKLEVSSDRGTTIRVSFERIHNVKGKRTDR